MAYGKFLVGKPSGGVTTVTVTDGATNTNLVLPESGTVSGVTTAVTDNAIARYDGTTGALQDSGVIIDDSGSLLLTAGTGAIGYGTGAGGTVTQLTSKSTAVTLNKPSGRITTHNAALAAGATIAFTLNNSIITTSDTVACISSTGNYRVYAFAIGAGIALIEITNKTAGSLSEAFNISFNITKGATA